MKFIERLFFSMKWISTGYSNGFYLLLFSSRKMIDVPTDFQEAIQLGLEDQSLCKATYTACSNSLVDISKKTFNNIMPTDLSGFSRWLSSVKAWAED